MKKYLGLAIILFFSLGCARVRVEAPKEPIKVDISMRLDVYQHVAKDIEAIEGIVSGKSTDKHGFLTVFIDEAYAQEGLSPQVEQAALRRKDRLQELSSWEAKGVLGETNNGLLQIRNNQESNFRVGEILNEENRDRMEIYEALAAKNGTSVKDVQKLYAKRLQADAPSGTPIEDDQGAWRIK